MTITQEYETNIALREAHHIKDSDDYFNARPRMDSDNLRNLFASGYERGWQAAISQHKAVQDAKPEWAKYDTSYLVAYIKENTRFDSDLVKEMLQFAINAAAPSDSKALVESEPVVFISLSSFNWALSGMANGIGTFSYIKDKTDGGCNIPLYTHPTPADTVKQDALDAARYRWLREKSRDPDADKPHCVVTKEVLEQGKPAKMVSYLKFDEALDDAIDAALQAK